MITCSNLLEILLICPEYIYNPAQQLGKSTWLLIQRIFTSATQAIYTIKCSTGIESKKSAWILGHQ